MTTNITNIELSRNQFYGMWIIIAVLIAVLLWIWLKWPPPPPPLKPWQPTKDGGLIQDGEIVPISPRLKDFLEREDYPVIMLPRAKGGVKIVDRNFGRDTPPCKSSEKDTGVECQLHKVNVEAIEQILISIVEVGDPTLCHDYRVNGTQAQVHADGPNAGLAPCEPDSSHEHYVP